LAGETICGLSPVDYLDGRAKLIPRYPFVMPQLIHCPVRHFTHKENAVAMKIARNQK
jgi:hypothetical protein